MSKERRRGKETVKHFPKISGADLRRSMDEVGNLNNLPPEKVDKLIQDFLRNDSFLAQFIIGSSEPSDAPENFNPQDFIIGACFMHKVLTDAAGKRGYKLPNVTTNTINSFSQQMSEASNALVTELPSNFDWTKQTEASRRYVEMIAEEKFKSVELEYPLPRKYSKENSLLMIWLTLQESFFGMGAMLVYELKRRQFDAEAMRKKFLK